MKDQKIKTKKDYLSIGNINRVFFPKKDKIKNK